MNHIVELPEGKLKLYYNQKVYSPKYSSIDTVVVAWQLIKRFEINSVLDVACGSGIIGLGLKKMFPELDVTLTDISPDAVKIARVNASKNHLTVKVKRADLTQGEADMVTANLPTFSREDMFNLHGPREAYYAGEPMFFYDKLLSVGHPLLVCECQKKYQDKFLQLSEDRGYGIILRSDMAFALSQ